MRAVCLLIYGPMCLFGAEDGCAGPLVTCTPHSNEAGPIKAIGIYEARPRGIITKKGTFLDPIINYLIRAYDLDDGSYK